MRPSANRHKTTTDNAPRANAGDSSVHEHAGQLGSTTHKQLERRAKTNNSRRVPKDSPGAPIGTVGRVARRPATATQKQTSSEPLPGKPTAGDTVSPRGD